MNLISWGLDHLYKFSSQNVEKDLLIGFPSQAMFPVKGAITQCKQFYDSAQVKVMASRYHVMIDRDTFTKCELSIVRGLIVEEVDHPRRSFELVLDNLGSHFDNDSEGRKIVLVMNLRKPC